MAMAAREDRSFEQEWPDLARKLQSLLSAKRVPACKREDIVQETGLRLFRMWDQVDPDRPVWALTVTIALNLVRDEARRRSTHEVLGAVPDVPSSYDVERSGLARIELARVEHALSQMTPAHRSVLLAEVGDEASLTRGANAVKMLRMRARRRLTSLLESASASGVLAGIRLRKIFKLDHGPFGLRTPGDGHELASAAAGIAAAVAMFSFVPQALTPPAHANPHVLGRDHAALALGLPDVTAQALFAHAVGPRTLARNTAAKAFGGSKLRGRANSLFEKSRHVRIGMGPDYIEGAAEVDVLGMKAKFEDRDEEPPVCVSGLPVDAPSTIDCGDGAHDQNHDGPAGGKIEIRVKIGHWRHSVTIDQS